MVSTIALGADHAGWMAAKEALKGWLINHGFPMCSTLGTRSTESVDYQPIMRPW